jgi:hypothetical protein
VIALPLWELNRDVASLVQVNFRLNLLYLACLSSYRSLLTLESCFAPIYIFLLFLSISLVVGGS